VHAWRPLVLSPPSPRDQAGRRRLFTVSDRCPSKDDLGPAAATLPHAAPPPARRPARLPMQGHGGGGGRARGRAGRGGGGRARAWRPQRPLDHGLARSTGFAPTSWRLTVRSAWAAAPLSTSGRAPLQLTHCTPCSNTLWQHSSLEAAAARCAAAGAAEARRARSDQALCWPHFRPSTHGRRQAWRCLRHPSALVHTGRWRLQWHIRVPFMRHVFVT